MTLFTLCRHAGPAALAAALCVPAGLAAQSLPADAEGAVARLNASPRHGEWVVYAAGADDSVRAWVVYPERRERAPVVIVIHEIYGLTDWVRGVTDQLAAEGFIAIAPDLLSGKGVNGGGSETVDQQGAVALIRTLPDAEVQRRLRAAAAYGTALPAASNRVGAIGFCWGGSTSFAFATTYDQLRAAVVFYGTSPANDALARVRARVLGLYAGDDARVGATVPAARAEMARLHKPFEVETFEGAGHGFLRQLTGRDGANLRAAGQAWPRAVAFLRESLR